jgi:hypothetical protein
MSEKGESAGFARSGSDELLSLAAENLKKSIEYAVSQLGAKKVRGEMKLRWSRSLTKQVEALVKVAEALNETSSKSAVDVDFASYLSGVQTRVPRRYVSKRLDRIVRRTQSGGSSGYVSRRVRRV